MQSYSKLICIAAGAVLATAGIWYLYKKSNSNKDTTPKDTSVLLFSYCCQEEKEVENVNQTKTEAKKIDNKKTVRDISVEESIDVLKYIRALMEPNSVLLFV